MRYLVSSLLCVFSLSLTAQEIGFGQANWLIIDEERDNREIPCVVWYPAEESGAEAIPLGGDFPVFIMAHGFLMSATDYEDLALLLVNSNYVFVALDTEQGLMPDHESFGLDLSFVANQIVGGVSLGFLDESLSGRVAIGGHSMGGGASWLAAAQTSSIDAVVAMAPADTDPSAILAGENITIPVLVISGAADTVTPPETQHEPIYNSAVNSSCRAFVSIEDAGHCGFADTGTLCNLGEFGFSGLSQEDQLELSVRCIVPWLDYFVNDFTLGLELLESEINSEELLTMDMNCTLEVKSPTSSSWQVYPNPVSFILTVDLGDFIGVNTTIKLYDSSSKLVFDKQSTSTLLIDVSGYAKGLYTLELSTSDKALRSQVVIE